MNWNYFFYRNFIISAEDLLRLYFREVDRVNTRAHTNWKALVITDSPSYDTITFCIIISFFCHFYIIISFIDIHYYSFVFNFIHIFFTGWLLPISFWACYRMDKSIILSSHSHEFQPQTGDTQSPSASLPPQLLESETSGAPNQVHVTSRSSPALRFSAVPKMIKMKRKL